MTAIPIRTSFEVAGDGYVEFDKSLLPHRGRQRGEKISLTLSTTELNGLVFWQGPRPEEESGDYLILLMLNGFIEFRYLECVLIYFLTQQLFCSFINLFQ